MADKTTSNIGFEKQIWDAACVLRGNMLDGVCAFVCDDQLCRHPSRSWVKQYDDALCNGETTKCKAGT